jgi:hypothetical protein
VIMMQHLPQHLYFEIRCRSFFHAAQMEYSYSEKTLEFDQLREYVTEQRGGDFP